MFCKQCGSQILDDSQFCENCGARIAAPAAAPAAATAPAPAPVQQAPQTQPVQPAQPYPVYEQVSTVQPNPAFQPVQVNPVYPPNSVYAANAYAASQAAQYQAVQPGMTYQQYAPNVYQQPVPSPVYVPYDQPQGNRKFALILRIVSGITCGFYFLWLLAGLMEGSDRTKDIAGVFIFSGISVFTLIYSLCKKNIGKGSFIALLISTLVSFYLFLDLVGIGT